MRRAPIALWVVLATAAAFAEEVLRPPARWVTDCPTADDCAVRYTVPADEQSGEQPQKLVAVKVKAKEGGEPAFEVDVAPPVAAEDPLVLGADGRDLAPLEFQGCAETCRFSGILGRDLLARLGAARDLSLVFGNGEEARAAHLTTAGLADALARWTGPL